MIIRLTCCLMLLCLLAAGDASAQCCARPGYGPPPPPMQLVPMQGTWQPQVTYRQTNPWFGFRWPWNQNVIRYRVRREWRWQPAQGPQPTPAIRQGVRR